MLSFSPSLDATASSFCLHFLPPPASSLYIYIYMYIYISLLRGSSSTIVRLFLYLHFLPARYLSPHFPSLLLSASLYLQSFLILPLPHPFLLGQSPQHISFIRYFLLVFLRHFHSFSGFRSFYSLHLVYSHFLVRVLLPNFYHSLPFTSILINLICRHFLLLYPSSSHYIFTFSSL